MPRPLVRFLHAAGLRLDDAVDDAASAGPLRDLLAGSADHALQKLVAAAVEREVDFVLLGGDTFRDEARSVAARGLLVGAAFGQIDRRFQVQPARRPVRLRGAAHCQERQPSF